MAPTVQQFPQPASGFFSLPAVPPTAAHLLDRSIGFTTANSNNSGIPPLQFPLGFQSVVSGFQIPSKFFAACLSSLCNEPEEKEKFEGAYFLPPPSTPWKKPVKRSEPPVMINGVQAFKKTSNVVQISPLRTAFIPTPSELSELTSHGAESEDADFQRHQLVPRAFLTQPLWSQLIPSNFVTRSTRSTHLTLPCTSIFVLEPKAGKILFRPAHFVVTVTGPGECIVPVQMRTDCDQNGKELRYVYCFRPQEPGTYLAKVRIAANGVPHVSQSPLKFRVTKSLPPPCPPPHPMMTRGGGVSDSHTNNPHNNNNNNNSNINNNNKNNNLLENSCPWLMNNPRNNSNQASVMNPIMNNTVIPSYPELGVLC